MKIPPLGLYRLGVRFPKTVLGLSLLLTVLSLFGARNLEVESDLTALLPHDTESVRHFEAMKEHFGGMGHLVVTVEAGDPDLRERFAGEFVAKIEGHPDILYVDYRPPADYFSKRKWLYLDKEDLEEIDRRIGRTLQLQDRGISPFLSRWIGLADAEDLPDLEFRDVLEKYEKRYLGAPSASANEKGRLTVLWVKARENPQNLDASRRLIEDIRGLERTLREKPVYRSVQIGYTGDYETAIEQADFTSREIAHVSLVVFILLLLVIILFFRKADAVFLIGIPLALGIIWTGGVVGVLLKHLNVLTGFAAAILAGLGSDYGIYLLSRYRQERGKGENFDEACRLAFSQTGKATFGSMITTVAAFASLLFSDFEVFSEFGIVGGIGLVLNYLAMILVIPALLSWRKGSEGRRPSVTPKELFSRALFNTRGAAVGVAVTLVLTCLSAFTIPAESTIRYEDAGMQPPDLPGNRLSDRVITQEGIYSSPTLLLHQGAVEEEKTVRRLDTLIHNQPGDRRIFERVLGLSSFVPISQVEKKKILGRIAEKFERVRLFLDKRKKEFLSGIEDSIRSEPITTEGLPKEVRHRFESVSEKGTYAVYLYSAMERNSVEEMRRYQEGVKELARTEGLRFIPVDSNFITHDVITLIQREAPRGLAMILLFLAGFAFITIRPLSRGIVIFLHLVGGLVLMSGILRIAHIPLNVINVVVFPIILGTGIDCFIHLHQRYEETADLGQVLKAQVPSILVSNLTTLIGFGGLILTSSSGLRSIGWVAVIGIGLITLLCLFVFPRALALRRGFSGSRG